MKLDPHPAAPPVRNTNSCWLMAVVDPDSSSESRCVASLIPSGSSALSADAGGIDFQCFPHQQRQMLALDADRQIDLFVGTEDKLGGTEMDIEGMR